MSSKKIIYMFTSLIILTLIIIAYSQDASAVKSTAMTKNERLQQLIQAKQKLDDIKNQYEQLLLLSPEERMQNRKKFTDEEKQNMRSELKVLMDAYKDKVKNTNDRLNISVIPIRDKNGDISGFSYGSNVPENVKKYLEKKKERFTKKYWENRLNIKKPEIVKPSSLK